MCARGSHMRILRECDVWEFNLISRHWRFWKIIWISGFMTSHNYTSLKFWPAGSDGLMNFYDIYSYSFLGCWDLCFLFFILESIVLFTAVAISREIGLCFQPTQLPMLITDCYKNWIQLVPVPFCIKLLPLRYNIFRTWQTIKLRGIIPCIEVLESFET